MDEVGSKACLSQTLSMFTSRCLSDCSLDCSDRLVGLVVKASASRVEAPGFESRLQLLSQCGSTYNCLSGSVPEIH